jgi:hypothetical protein
MYQDTLESFIKSDHFKNSVVMGAVCMATTSDWKFCFKKVEIFPDRWLFTTGMDNYHPLGIILHIPIMDWSYASLASFLSNKKGSEKEFFSHRFEECKAELSLEIRNDLQREMRAKNVQGHI